MALKNLIPMLNVSGIEASLEFYRETLDFKVVSNPAAVKEWRWATIRSGWTAIMLAQSGPPTVAPGFNHPESGNAWSTIFYFYPDDVAHLCAQVLARGYQPTALKSTVYGMREFSLSDQDDHRLSFGQDEKGQLQ
jgi:uncharacterized glyoxalase superfamily protein PhnB